METRACEQLSLETWKETCDFFGHDYLIQKGRVVEVYGFVRKLLPCQAHAVYRGLLMIHSPIHHYFHGHGMGIGKSTIMLCTNHIQTLVNLLWKNIGEQPEGHFDLSRDEPTADFRCQHDNLIRSKYKLPCPCSPTSTSHCIRYDLGCTILISPKGLLRNWHAEFKSCYGDETGNISDQTNPIGFRFILGHTLARRADGTEIDLDAKQKMSPCYEEGWDKPKFNNETNRWDWEIAPQFSNSLVIYATTS